jgi:DNA processing protein
VAVLGCGIDRDYPAGHAELARRIADAGLIVSEYAPGVEPAPWRFPARNRIVAGLCAATVVVEARERSGALITADLALEEGREVFAVPGEITSALSAGTNALLKLGAAPLTGATDVLHSFGIELEPEAGESSPLLDLLPASADELVRQTGLPAAEVAAALVELELEGRAVAHDGVYRRAS